MPEPGENKKKSYFEGRLGRTLFEGRIIGCAPKIPHRLNIVRFIGL